MLKSKHFIVLSSLMALLIYLGPNMVLDVHRVFGHHHHHCASNSGTGFHRVHSEKCSVCTFEFNVVDEPNNFRFNPLPQTISFLMPVAIHNQFQNSTFKYYQLRAPPLA